MGIYHRFRRQIGLELSTNNTTVPVRPGNLAPNATVVRSILLHLCLVDVGQALPGVPRHLFLGVHSLNLNQRSVRVLVRLRPSPTQNSKRSQKSLEKQKPKSPLTSLTPFLQYKKKFNFFFNVLGKAISFKQRNR